MEISMLNQKVLIRYLNLYDYEFPKLIYVFPQFITKYLFLVSKIPANNNKISEYSMVS